MAQEPGNLTLIYLRPIGEKVDRLIHDMNDVKARLTGVEGLHQRIDQLELSVERIERRLDLTEAS